MTSLTMRYYVPLRVSPCIDSVDLPTIRSGIILMHQIRCRLVELEGIEQAEKKQDYVELKLLTICNG